jgi:peroxiredoxin
MNTLYNDKSLTKRGLRIVTVNLDSKKERADRFLKKYPANFDIIFDPKHDLAKKYNVKGMPISYILDSKGNILYKHIGFKNSEAEELRKKIESFL